MPGPSTPPPPPPRALRATQFPRASSTSGTLTQRTALQGRLFSILFLLYYTCLYDRATFLGTLTIYFILWRRLFAAGRPDCNWMSGVLWVWLQVWWGYSDLETTFGRCIALKIYTQSKPRILEYCMDIKEKVMIINMIIIHYIFACIDTGEYIQYRIRCIIIYCS